MCRTRRSATAFALALSSLVALPARAQELEPPAVKPVHVETGVPGLESESWDGRIMISNCFMDHDPNRFGWVACVFRPERVVRRADGTPDFSQGAFSDGKGSDVGGVPLEFDSAPGSGMGAHQTIALCRRPGYDANPFRSQPDGTPDPNGGYETYEATVITPFVNPPNNEPPTVGMRHARFVVSAPRTKDAALVSATMLDPYTKLHAVDGQEIRGIEPSVTADGRLIVFQGHPRNDGSIDILMYTYNATPDRTDGWSVPKCLVEMNRDAKTLVDGIPFAERFPLAKAPLRASDGTVFASGELLHGAYPWVAHDGTEVFYTATIAGTPGVDQARRGGESVIGRWTGNQARHIDGPINMDRSKTVRLIVSSPGAKPSFWSPYPEVKDGPIPYTAARPVFPLFTGTQHDYDEISFEDFVDQDYVLALHMNEVVTKSGDYDPTRTQDTSGSFNTGKLEGARFPQEYDGSDELRGVVGQGIYFGDEDLVRVKDAPSLHGGPSLSVQLWVKRLVDLAQGTNNEFRFLAGKPGSWDVILEQDGHLHVLVTAGGRTRDSGIVGTTVPVGEWTSVAFTYDGATGALRTYQRGVKVGEVVTGPGAVDSSTQDLLVGPAGRQPPASFVPAGRSSEVTRRRAPALRSAKPL